MGEVFPLASTCEYLVRRASAHRRAGRYDEAMALLARARETYGLREDVEFELAQTYDELGLEDEAARSYLRVVRTAGELLSQALFQLALSAAQRGELPRAMAYYERFLSTDRKGVSEEFSGLFSQQLRGQIERPAPRTKKQRALALERRSVERLQAGKTAAAVHCMRHSLRLKETPQGYALLACCAMIDADAQAALENAEKAHRLGRRRVQTLCVLADAYSMAGDEQRARRAVQLAAMRAKETDDLFAVAAECAKRGMDAWTIRLTGRILGREPHHTRAMMMRGCAMMNLGRRKEASRLFGRVCGLMPEDSICEAYYRLACGSEELTERLTLGMDVTRAEAQERVTRMIAAMADEQPDRDDSENRLLCRHAVWALRSPLAGRHGALMAIMLLSDMPVMDAYESLLDALMEPRIPDGMKLAILQVLTARHGVKPYYADIGGRLVRLAAGGTAQGNRTQSEQETVQRAADRLMQRFPDAPGVMLPMWIAYLNAYGAPPKQRQDACVAALELMYHEASGRKVNERAVAREHGVSLRACRHCIRMIRRAMKMNLSSASDEKTEEILPEREENDHELRRF
ncbi:MAG: tetratricopeptide repeat protein [Clostridia bacterium]|nr:tetratricopeptide repeat protein [Clostridia bacterium]